MNGMQRYPDHSARSLPRLLERLLHLRPASAWSLVLGCVVLAALGDAVTGPGVWFGPAYLLVLSMAAWCLGWRLAMLVGCGCMLLTFAINGMTLYPHGTSDILWNFALRFAAMTVILALVAASRRAYIREWWRARTDLLTGALNRQAFFELGAALAKVGAWRLLIYADLDGLKKINDQQGHAAGDSVLRAYASAVGRAIRRNDLFARVGGDEFIIFMSVKDDASARAVASRLHALMNNIRTDGGLSLRCSVGALVVPPGEMQPDDLVRLADDLMYQAKLRGACLNVDVAEGSPEAVMTGLPREVTLPPFFRPAAARVLATDRRAGARA